MSRYVHKIEISLVGIEHLSKEKKEQGLRGHDAKVYGTPPSLLSVVKRILSSEGRSLLNSSFFFILVMPLLKIKGYKHKEVTDE